MSAAESRGERRMRLFAELCDLDAGARRTALDDLARTDAEAARELEELLAHDGMPEGPIERLRGAVVEAAERRLLDGEPAAPPARLGAWRLGESLGAGGMGEVWSAERVDGGFTQRAAVKLVRAGMASREVLQRFAVERQVLARLEHPAIARLFDGGLAPDGRPWFAMERVDGTPITRFAAEHGLAIAARLRLFLEVCGAVDFAHRSLVVHRDLKPSNILVSGDGHAKLLDFGLAKLLEAGDAGGADPHATRTELRALTPAYAAPEQILGQPVTTATDVYSLGVILFELLTGELPHARRSTSATTLAVEVELETIERPSERLRRLASRGPGGNAEARRIEGDLDTIALKAMARDRERRYPSVAALAADVAAHLEGRPISARPDSLRYRAGKFVRRNRFAVASIALVTVSLVAGFSISLVQARRAERAAAAARLEARRAERVKQFLTSVFEQADPEQTNRAEVTAKQILAEGSRRLEKELGGEPEVRAELHDTVARIQLSLGLFDEGLESARTAQAERRRLFGDSSLEAAQSGATVGKVLLGQGKLDEAREELDRSLARFAAAGDTTSVEYAEALSGRAQARMLTGDPEGSRRDETATVAIVEAAFGPEDPRTLEHLSNLAVIETEVGSFAEAARILRRILATFEAQEGKDSAKVLSVALNLATALDTAGETAEALTLFERVVAGRRRIYGPNHPAVAEALVITSLRLSRAGRAGEALAALAEARATYAPIDHPELGTVDNYSGLALVDLGRYAEAERAFESAAARFRETLGAEHVMTVNALANEANAVAEQGRVGEALSMFDAAAAALRKLGEFDNPRLLRMRLNWVAALRKAGRYAEARQALEAAMALAREKLGAGHMRLAEGEVELARLDLAEGGAGAAESARAHIAAAEAVAAAKVPSPSFTRNLAAAKGELLRSGG